MGILSNLKPQKVFEYFEEISAVPRGSGNMDKISEYCVDFAKKHGFKYYTDELKNVVIYKDGTKGYENSQPVILQGHLDIVCQKTKDCDIDFLNDGLNIYVDDDYIKAKGTTLGADNGIAVAMVLAILDSDDIAHPPIEAVFTSDEETGMYGARVLDTSILKGKRMINMDSEEVDCITVSCAGGSDFKVFMPLEYKNPNGTKVKLCIKGLKGGHSGVEINSGRLNANKVAGQFLDSLKDVTAFDIISINGGDKPNAIPNLCDIELCVENYDQFISVYNSVSDKISVQIKEIEKDFCPTITKDDYSSYKVFSDDIKDTLITVLKNVPNGVIKMSKNIDNLVETSLNLGILQTNSDELILHFSLRSNTKLGLAELEKDMFNFFTDKHVKVDSFGHYPPWEYKEDSLLRELYKDTYFEQTNKLPRVEALHAGLECGVFASSISDFDCIAVGPTIHDVHTVNEKLSISSTMDIFSIIVRILSKLK